MVEISKYHVALIIAVIATSSSSILIRLTGNYSPALVTAAWRMLLSTIGTFCIIRLTNPQNERLSLLEFDRKQFFLFILSGIFLGIHFSSWFLSLDYTSVAASVTVVDLSPLIVILLGAILLNEHINRNQFFGIVIAMVGALTIALGSFDSSSTGSNPPLGVLLSFIGALGVSGYLIIGRISRSTNDIDMLSYTFWVYLFSTLVLFLLAFIFNTRETVQSFLFQLPWEAYFGYFLLAIGPSLLGHSLYNYSLKHFKTAIISIMTLGEPIIASVLAIFFFQEIPSVFIVFGALLVIPGVAYTIWLEEDTKPSPIPNNQS